MNEIENALRELATPVPAELENQTMFDAGAADRVSTIDSPFGPVWVAWSTRGITGLTPRFACETIAIEAEALPSMLEQQITAALEHGETLNVPVDLRGIGDFQAQVLKACASIQPGTTRSYGWIAHELANPGAVRAVGTALGQNPIPLIVPCHRVVRSDGAIGNYAFGPEMKQQLLVREGAILA